MFCFQCQETVKNTGCTVRGVCGKTDETAAFQDLLIYTLTGISVLQEKCMELGNPDKRVPEFIAKMLFTTITNVNFDKDSLISMIQDSLQLRDSIYRNMLDLHQSKTGQKFAEQLHDSATWQPKDASEFYAKARTIGVLSTENPDVRSLQQFLIIGLKGVAAYADHALILGEEREDVNNFFSEALASTTKELSVDEMTALLLKCGEIAVSGMSALDAANTKHYGNPEITKVNLGVKNKPGILISGHDLKDLEELMIQTQGTGIDVYTHGEMLPAHYYPAFKKYDNFVGNYGGSWWHQNAEFASFNGVILMTTNCIIPVKDSYKHRIFTTGVVRYPEVQHIPDRKAGQVKDFSKLIELAKTCESPTELEKGEIIGGFAHNQVIALADKIVEAVKTGAIKRFIVMAGCDGRHKTRNYFTEVAEKLPKDTVILTAGCAKYRYNKLNLGDINGIPRVLDAGQCNDSYSLAVIALKLKEIFGLQDVNELPISFDIAWYEQKAVTVLLALLSLGFKGIRLGPTLPGFVSPAVANVLVEKFNIKVITTPEADIEAMLTGN